MAVEQKDKIGALWIKSSRGGVEFMSGEVEIEGVKHRITVFRNGYKTTDKQPSYHIYRDSGAPPARAEAPVTSPAPQSPAAPEELPSIDVNDDRDDFRGPARW